MAEDGCGESLHIVGEHIVPLRQRCVRAGGAKQVKGGSG